LVYLQSSDQVNVPTENVTTKRVESEPGEQSVGTKARHCAY
jgi:hypothetical protein